MYDKNNIFAKIISGEISSDKIHEDDHVIAINDINPVAPVHMLVIPKKPYADFADFISKATKEEVSHYFSAIKNIAENQGLKEYRLVSNKGTSAGQSVFHFHTHIIGGKTIHGLIDS